MKKAIGIYREVGLAGKPGSDYRILDLTADELKNRGFEVSAKDPKDFIPKENNHLAGQKKEEENPDLIFTMARGREVNDVLEEKENQGVFIINSPRAIRFSFDRKLTYEKMAEEKANVPKTKIVKVEDVKIFDIEEKSILKPAGRHEFWFVVNTGGEEEFREAMEEYRKQDIKEIVIQKFIKGKHIKYYVIGDEVILPKNAGEEFSEEIIEGIRKQALLSGKVTGLKIFGGDFIVEEETNIPFCISAEDWLSMASLEGFTQGEATVKIVDLIEKEYKNFEKDREQKTI